MGTAFLKWGRDREKLGLSWDLQSIVPESWLRHRTFQGQPLPGVGWEAQVPLEVVMGIFPAHFISSFLSPKPFPKLLSLWVPSEPKKDRILYTG